MSTDEQALAEFLGAYFNQLWPMDSASWEGIADLFLGLGPDALSNPYDDVNGW